jgi:hypothetical protein
VVGNMNTGTRTRREATPILATGVRFQGATLNFGLILVMTGVRLMVATHGGGKGNNILGTGTRDHELTLIVQELRRNLVSRNGIQVTRNLSAQSTSQVRQEIRRSKLVMIPNLNRQFQRYSNLKKLAKPKWTKDRRVKVVSLFLFRCYEPGHEKLECKAKLFCDICASNEHLIGHCLILKQPRLMAHPCGYDVNRLGFYHIPHAPVSFGKANNTSALVSV